MWESTIDLEFRFRAQSITTGRSGFAVCLLRAVGCYLLVSRSRESMWRGLYVCDTFCQVPGRQCISKIQPRGFCVSLLCGEAQTQRPALHVYVPQPHRSWKTLPLNEYSWIAPTREIYRGSTLGLMLKFRLSGGRTAKSRRC